MPTMGDIMIAMRTCILPYGHATRHASRPAAYQEAVSGQDAASGHFITRRDIDASRTARAA